MLILDNLGEIQSSILTGDINGDGMTDGVDIAQVLNDLGNTFMQPTDSFGVCDDFFGCGTERVKLPSGSACLTWLYCDYFIASLRILDPTIDIDSITPSDLFDWFDYDSIDFPFNNCADLLLSCSGTCIQYAISRIIGSCIGQQVPPGAEFGDIFCVPCGCVYEQHEGSAATTIRCGDPSNPLDTVQNKIIIKICAGCATNGDPDFCETLAHELVHVAQYCDLGLLNSSCDQLAVYQEEFFSHPFNFLCHELQAFSELNAIGCGTTMQSDCEEACSSSIPSHGPFWASYGMSCEQFCQLYGACCQGSEFTPTPGCGQGSGTP